MAYKNNESMRLNDVYDLGLEIESILDIGAHKGQKRFGLHLLSL